LSPVVVVGGGLSGLAAAVTLASKGVPVHLLEQKPFLGGRAYSFVDATTGDTIDNGQHLLIAGYERTMAFLRAVGAESLVTVQSRPVLPFHHPERGFITFALPLLPPPANLLVGILGTTLVGIPDRLRLLRAGVALRNDDEQGLAALTITEWLDRVGQTPETTRCLWDPLAVSIMNERSEQASALLFVRALRRAFLGSSRGAALVFPRVGLSELFAQPAARFIGRNGGSIDVSADVAELVLTDGRVTGVRTRDNTMLPTSACIVAVPRQKALQLLPQGMLGDRPARAADDRKSSPIVSIHLWFDAPFMKESFIGLIGRRIQWVFNRRLLAGAGREGECLSTVISAAYEFVGLDNENLVRIAVDDVRSVYGDPLPPVRHAVVLREKKATDSFDPSMEARRPGVQTSVPNLFLAGDWTATGLPATIEGAILSGEKAGEVASAHLAKNSSM
jgi:hydroxysqualene dehydroxylase